MFARSFLQLFLFFADEELIQTPREDLSSSRNLYEIPHTTQHSWGAASSALGLCNHFSPLLPSLPASFWPPRLPGVKPCHPLPPAHVKDLPRPRGDSHPGGDTRGSPSPRCARTLHHTPGVLPGLCHLVANLHLLGAADHCEREVDLPATQDRERLSSPCCKHVLSSASTRPLPPQASAQGKRKGRGRAEERGAQRFSGIGLRVSDPPYNQMPSI